MAYDYASDDCSTEIETIGRAIEAKDERISDLESEVEKLTERVGELEDSERGLETALLEAKQRLEAAEASRVE
jgi:predicted  nucleic acid-binding Zn-ribbon protein